MQYITKPGDTLLSIATSKTLSPAYADALANLNNIAEVPVTAQLEEGLGIDIPDNWLKGGAAGFDSKATLWAVVGIGLALALTGGSGHTPRRRRTRRR